MKEVDATVVSLPISEVTSGVLTDATYSASKFHGEAAKWGVASLELSQI